MLPKRSEPSWVSLPFVRSPSGRSLFLAISCCAIAWAPLAGAQPVSVSGKITVADGVGLPGVLIELRSSTGELRETRSDSVGDFELSGLTSGRYVARVLADGFVVEERPVEIVTGETPAELLVTLTAVPEALDDLVVSASYSLNRETPVDSVAFSREALLELPTFGDDLFRAISLVPGTSGNDLSSAFAVRGAPYEQVLVRLDGVELFEPFHLKDFAGVLSVVDPQMVAGVEIFPGAFPAAYGDRQAAVVDLTTRTASGTENRLGISLSSLYATRAARLGREEQGSYLLSLRRGWLDVVFNLVGPDEEEEEEGAPEYADVFAKLDWTLDERTDFGVWALWADDTLDSSELEDDGTQETIDSSYGNQWWVARGQRLWNDTAVTSGRFFAGQVDRERSAGEALGESDFDVRDVRALEILGLASDASFELGEHHLLSAGFELRNYEADYDYVVARRFTDPIAAVGERPQFSAFNSSVDGEAYGVWLSDRWRLGRRWVAELGARYDRQTWIEGDDDQTSPRLNLVYDLADDSVLRFGWGHAYQSQRPNELAVEDDDFSFYPAERSEHRTLGWEKGFARGMRLRVDAFQRLGTDLRPRYVNLFSPVVLFPEGTPDRVRLDPDRSRADGVEIFLQGRRTPRTSWWVSYAWSRVEDRIDGTWVPRQIDQTHALTADLSIRLGQHWNLNAAWIYHTGWPITGVSARLAESDDGPRIEPVLGPLFDDRVDDYHRLDVRASRSYDLPRGRMLLYFDVQNLYNRENERGFEFGEEAFQVQPDGSVRVTPEVESWLGAVPSFGVTWSF